MKNILTCFMLVTISLSLQGQNKFQQTGNASVIGDRFVGRYTANGEKYAHEGLTAAHLTLPFGSMVRVTNTENNKSVVVRINDRGPFAEDRIIDLSKSAASQLGFISGVKKVTIEVVDKKTSQQIVKKPAEPIKEKTTQGAFYKISSENVIPTGYGVQLASYKEPSNLLRLAENIKIESGHNPIVEIAENENGKTFRLIIGDFKTRKEAEQVKQKLMQTYPQCFVIQFD